MPKINNEKQNYYYDLSDQLRTKNDAQHGIKTGLNENDQWVRDASASFNLNARIPFESPVFAVNNALLRVLSRLRPIDYAIGKKYPDHVGENLRQEMKQYFDKLSEKLNNLVNQQPPVYKIHEEIKQYEKEFNHYLMTKLHQANMTQGCETTKEAEKLLGHYRNLSSLLMPARTMVTLTYDEKAKVLQRETQYPVTMKTDIQKEAIRKLKTLNPCPVAEDKSAHTVRNLATQEADSLFVDLMLEDDRTLPAQTRYTHLAGTKNAFIVKNELFFNIPQDFEINKERLADNILWFARTGVPVYVGKGEHSGNVQLHTKENLQQIRKAAAHLLLKNDNDLTIHITTLNTFTPLKKQAMMLNHLYRATRNNPDTQDNISYVPVNLDGTFRKLDIASGLYPNEEEGSKGYAFLNKKTRSNSAAQILLQAGKKMNTISVVNCASGQDRTGTIVERAVQIWMADCYKNKGIHQLESIQTMRAKGGNAAEIATHLVHGSPGLKTISIAKDLFNDQANKQFYRASAETNKENTIGKVTFFLKYPGAKAIENYFVHLNAFKNAAPNHLTRDLHLKRLKIIRKIKKITHGSPGQLRANELADLTYILKCCKDTLNEPNRDNIKKISGLINMISGKTLKWKRLGFTLTAFAGAALVTIGVVAAIPTGGTSLLLSAVGAAGLSSGAGIGIGSGAITATGVAGIGLFKSKSGKGLARAITGFKSSIESLPQSEIQHPEEYKEDYHDDYDRLCSKL